MHGGFGLKRVARFLAVDGRGKFKRQQLPAAMESTTVTPPSSREIYENWLAIL